MTKAQRLLLVLCCVFFLQACGVKFWYNRLDWLVPWYLDDYVELSDIQEERLELFLQDKTKWHRKSQLPLYIDMLERMTSDLETNNIHQTYDQYGKELTSFFKILIQELAPELVEQITTLSDQQIEHMLGNVQSHADKQRKKYDKKSPQDRLDDLEDSLTDNVKDWIGRLSDKQKELISQWAKDIKPTASLNFEYRSHWREAFKLALQERHSESGKAALLSLISDPRQLQGQALKNNQAYNEQLEKTYTLQLLDSLSKKQKKKVIKRLNDYKEDFQDLNEQD